MMISVERFVGLTRGGILPKELALFGVTGAPTCPDLEPNWLMIFQAINEGRTSRVDHTLYEGQLPIVQLLTLNNVSVHTNLGLQLESPTKPLTILVKNPLFVHPAPYGTRNGLVICIYTDAYRKTMPVVVTGSVKPDRTTFTIRRPIVYSQQARFLQELTRAGVSQIGGQFRRAEDCF